MVEEGTSNLLTNGKVRPPAPRKQILTMPAFFQESPLLFGAVPWVSACPVPHPWAASLRTPTAIASSGKGQLFVSPHFLPLWEPLLSPGTSASRHLSQGPKVGKRRGWGCREGGR